MNSHNSLHKQTKNKFIQNISRLISSLEITPITSPAIGFIAVGQFTVGQFAVKNEKKN